MKIFQNHFQKFHLIQRISSLRWRIISRKKFYSSKFWRTSKRINKKKPSKKLQNETPVFIRLYDILFFKGKDIRNENLIVRKKN